MASQTRDTRRTERAGTDRANARATRSAAIWHGGNAPAHDDAERAPLQQVNVRRFAVSGRVFSGLIVVALLLVLAIFISSDAFYVHSIAVAGQHYLEDTEIFTLSNLAGTHVFWIDPVAVRASLLRSPTVADADINITWGSPMVQIVVQEREPALVWDQAGVPVWVDVHGRVMRQREQRDDLLRVAVDGLSDGPPQGEVEADAVTGALQLHQLLPDVRGFTFNPDYGLGYNDGRGWAAWFGTGDDMPEKVLVYNALVADLVARGVRPTAIYVYNPNRPWYATL